MSGVLVNASAIFIGGLLSIFFKRFSNERLNFSIKRITGIIVFFLALDMALTCSSSVVMAVSLIVGGLIGKAIGFGKMLENSIHFIVRVVIGKERAAQEKGVLITSILYCTGAMAIVGSIQAGLNGDNNILFTKSILDGVFNLFMGSIYGIGVALSALPVLIYEGSIALVSSQLDFLAETSVLEIISGTGGVLLMMVGLDVAEIKKFPVGDYIVSMPLGIALVRILEII